MKIALSPLTPALIALGALGGWAASHTPLPLPWLLGSLIAVGAAAALARARLPADYRFPMKLRTVFIAVIGLMIGGQVDAALLGKAPFLLLSLGLLTLFTIGALGLNYLIFRRIGGYDKPTAFFCAAPGGLMESLALGEAAGADIPRLTIQQFLRIILVVSLLPLGISVIEGIPVGSAAGLGLGPPDGPGINPLRLAFYAALGGAGYLAGRMLRLPAAQLTGPLVAAALANLAGYGPVTLPGWLVIAAQVVVGSSLGARFLGVTGRVLAEAFRLGLLSVGAMLALAALCAALLRQATGVPFDVLLISFAPGGVTEMSLVALSLQASPAYVTLHHLYRILLTVLLLGMIGRNWRKAP